VTATLRPARSTDAGTTGQILHGFAHENDWMPELHSMAETIAFCGTMIDRGWGTVAEDKGKIVGFLARNGEEIHSLYLTPSARGQGIGQRLLEHTKATALRRSLFAFQANTSACRFYEKNGFVEAGRSDGTDNDENLPDIRYIWRKEGSGHG